MATSLNSVVTFFNSSKLQATYRRASTSSLKVSAPKTTTFPSFSKLFDPIIHLKEERSRFCLLVAESDGLAVNTSDKGPESAESSTSDNQISAVRSLPADCLPGSARDKSGPQTSGSFNGSTAAYDPNEERPSLQSGPRRSPLTARERLKAARVLSRYNESKSSKSEMGSKVLDALRENDRGKKRSRLPEAPTNLFDDSKRGLPKPGWTFQFPGGADLFIIVFSFVFISTVMFATTYVVWKSGAIHFNEY